ncbi:hypothetical protein SLEP1_g46920 [Rubroshorea leprosula]|uniref:Phorbol-ester/DAG-type domain-containing protein n=1 Tax=Rubroshorea leprosula TaxID=152421 RepID=A0AAV5LNY1_9ROSI|nr:hypothetical protein SLEP1_g46920 [Rubroshorea leprosula]
MSTTVKTKEDGQIRHFTHRHPLQLVDLNKEQYEVCCSICEKLCSDVVYGCRKCNFFLHHSCMDIPRVINQHQFHPKHSLVLLTTTSYKCKGCDRHCSGLAYMCGTCKFRLDVKCALLPTADCEVAEWIQRFSHQHSLQLIDPNKEEDEVHCSICRKLCSDFIYGCKKYNFFLHHSCMDIPREINQHPFHPHHSLVFLTKSSYKCKGCDKDCSGLAYKCQACLFELDIECALLPTANCEGAKWIQHVYHHHPLELCEIEDGHEAHCPACRENSPGPHFVCHRCNFFLHQSCAIDLLPQTIQDHPFHPNHCLKIKSYNKSERFFCRACGMDDFNVLGYCCEDCPDFKFHLDCSKLTPSIKYGNHWHLFTLFQKISFPGFCLICKDYCESFFLRCVTCDITLHLQCHPLAPKTLKHKHHRHPLTMTKSPLDSDLEYYGHRSEYYCDFCELPRPAWDPVYYCKECDLSADIQCFISQVLHSVTVDDQTSMTSGSGEDKDDNLKEGKSCSTTDPKVVKYEKEIAELRSELEHKEFKRKELKAQVEALQREIEDRQNEVKELSNGSSQLEKRIQKLERAHLSYIGPMLAKSKFKA